MSNDRPYRAPEVLSQPVAEVERLIAQVYAVQTERWRRQSKARDFEPANEADANGG